MGNLNLHKGIDKAESFVFDEGELARYQRWVEAYKIASKIKKINVSSNARNAKIVR